MDGALTLADEACSLDNKVLHRDLVQNEIVVAAAVGALTLGSKAAPQHSTKIRG